MLNLFFSKTYCLLCGLLACLLVACSGGVEPPSPPARSRLLVGTWNVEKFQTRIELAGFENVQDIDEATMRFWLGSNGEANQYHILQNTQEIIADTWQLTNEEQAIYLKGILADQGLNLQIGRDNTRLVETLDIVLLEENRAHFQNQQLVSFTSGGVTMQMQLWVELKLRR
jgi:hypothetical protein